MAQLGAGADVPLIVLDREGKAARLSELFEIPVLNGLFIFLPKIRILGAF